MRSKAGGVVRAGIKAPAVVDRPQLVATALARGTAALSRILPRLPSRTLAALAGAAVDGRVLVSVAMQPTVADVLVVEDPLIKARIRAVRAQRQLLEEEGGTLSAEEAGAVLGIKRQAVDKARRQGRLLGLSVAGRWRYPAWQFSDGQVLQGLREVLAALRS